MFFVRRIGSFLILKIYEEFSKKSKILKTLELCLDMVLRLKKIDFATEVSL